MVGEASLALATACFGRRGINGNSGHEATDVLYLAFVGRDAVPGARGAKWAADSFAEFEESITALGDRLVARIGRGNGTVTTPSAPPIPTVAPTPAAPGAQKRGERWWL